MNKYLILITILIILYLYWKTQQNQSNSPKPDNIIEFQGKDEVELSDVKFLPDIPTLSNRQKLKKK